MQSTGKPAVFPKWVPWACMVLVFGTSQHATMYLCCGIMGIHGFIIVEWDSFFLFFFCYFHCVTPWHNQILLCELPYLPLVHAYVKWSHSCEDIGHSLEISQHGLLVVSSTVDMTSSSWMKVSGNFWKQTTCLCEVIPYLTLLPCHSSEWW